MISVSPVEGGWAVRFDYSLQPMMFLSGGRAEAQARAMAAVMNSLGHAAEVRVHDRSGRLAGQSSYPVAPAEDDPLAA
ncbi:MAG: hypothetical protein ABI655_15345 [Phenylobacterium sp.]